ncbi:PKD domain-containing protein [Hymenobacter terrenus]|uniref:PKD domain-containing protein n=1 Tax=Hymenobacter terrenus TaxID=1629124 RepID=UPI0006977D69|nr:PKD domain-containing protein [Hymenobacter terrenus]
MKDIRNNAVWAFLGGSVLLASCDKNDTGSLEGPVPQGTFTTSARSVGLTTEVTFTAAPTNDAFLYQWEFGDGANGAPSVGKGQTVTHVYSKGGTFQTQLIMAGRGGTGFSEKKPVVIPSTLNLVKQYLTGGSARTWKLDNTVDAPIVVGPDDDHPTQYFAGGPAGSLPPCQADDEFTFTTANVYSYDAKAQTLVAGASCAAPRTASTPFTLGAATGAGVGQLTLATAGSFIGITDAPDLIYRILDIDDQHMTLRAGSSTASVVFTMKLMVK